MLAVNEVRLLRSKELQRFCQRAAKLMYIGIFDKDQFVNLAARHRFFGAGRPAPGVSDEAVIALRSVGPLLRAHGYHSGERCRLSTADAD